jgi:DNA-binding NarL/FixJ family response regulator
MLPVKIGTASSEITPLNPVSRQAWNIETALRDLLHAAEYTPGVTVDEESDHEQRLMFDVCLDGQLYQVSIVQSSMTPGALRPNLSPREREIARLISKGMPNKTIASTLNLSPCTVSSYTKRIFLKLNVNSRAEMVAKVLVGGLLKG